MNSISRLTMLVTILICVLFTELGTQQLPPERRVDPTLRRRTEIDGNNVRTSVFNFVFSGRTGAGLGVPYEFPKNTGRFYVALVALFIGGEVVDNTGETIPIVDLPAFRQSPTGADWNMGPLPGYFNPEVGKIAKSDEPDTWPDVWPDKLGDTLDPGWAGSWNGFFGKNRFNADQEIFYRAGDDNYDRWNYSPDTTYPDRRGLGMSIDVRGLQWSQASVADAVFFVQSVKNDGTKDIKKTAVTLWLADFVGGDGDSQDDAPSFDLIQDIAFSLDSDGISSNPAFQGVCVGAAATLYLETPGNAEDRIDNDGDSPEFDLGPRITAQMLGGSGPFPPEISGTQIDENRNGLIDEDSTHIPFGLQQGVGFADGIDNNDDGEPGSPVVTQAMINQSLNDPWGRWPANPENDLFQDSIIHLIDLDDTDLGKLFKDNIDNDNDSLSVGLPTVTQDMIDAAASDPFRRHRVPGTSVILYDVDSADLGKRYLDGDRLVNAGVDEGIDEMCDESRNDGVDNDGDWNPFSDDVGLDGAAATRDFGEGDGKPTSGVGTEFPGEPNIDKTDVSEADQIGLTNVQYLPAGAIQFETTADIFFWASFMIPGSFVDPSIIGEGEFDLFVSSGLFPLRAGQIEQISFAVVFGNAVTCPGDAVLTGAKADALQKREFAQLAYDEDYQFAQAPIEPTVTAVAGPILDANGNPTNRSKVTLHWDALAEMSEDGFLAGIGAPSMDFEGYRIYRATDPAFEDARVITDARGNPARWLRPIAQFDIKDGIEGLHPVDFNGVQFDLGRDTGLRHSWIDSTVTNGQKYYYAVRAYDQGLVGFPLPNPDPTQPIRILNLAPAESNLKISLDPFTAKVTSIGTSIAIVTPESPAAGYIPAKGSSVALVEGSTTGFVGYEIVDPDSILDNHKYRITFEDTVLEGAANDPDTFKTKNYTLADITEPSNIDTLIDRREALEDTLEQPLIDGFRLIISNEKSFGLNAELSGWNSLGIYPFGFRQWKLGFDIGLQKPSDYEIEFDAVGTDTSTAFQTGSTTWPAIPVNFKVRNTTEDKQIDFGFIELNLDSIPGIFSAGQQGFQVRSDIIVFLERDLQDSLVTTWRFDAAFDTSLRRPETGDIATIVLSKLFRSTDVFEFTTEAQRVDTEVAKNSLDKIKVVPNPYVAAATWEERNPFTSGRGPRSIHFNHLPQDCTIRIFTVSGELVETIDHHSTMLDGSAEWDLLTRDNLAVAYGIYIYHIDAGNLGQKVGKFAIIK